MKQKLIGIIIAILFFSLASTYAQENTFTVIDIKPHSLEFAWGSVVDEMVELQYGLTPDLELGKVKGLGLHNLKDASFYYVQAQINSKFQNYKSEIKLFTTASKSSGDIKVYFNNWVDNDASSIADAIYIADFEDSIVAYISRTQHTLDICNYNTGSLPIITAINNAEASGVNVRYIAADNTGTNNDELSNLSASIPIIQRPDDGEVMHNKFIIIDVDYSDFAKVLTGSVNHTDNSCHEDYNNMVILYDQALALAYEIEFEEMWGSSGDIPNESNAKFGDEKTDNTPHSFNIGGIPVELYFSPSDGTTEKIENAILTANTDMQFAVLTFINNDLGDAVIDIYDAGVDVKGIIENVYYFGSEYNGLQSAGVDVHSHFSEPYMFHHKYGIIDANNISSDPLVITGSHNWTNSAEDDYDENTLIIHDAEIANMYYEEFVARYADITGTDNNIENISDLICISPNPSNSHINIQAKHIIEKITIINAIGQTVYCKGNLQENTCLINVDFLTNGNYFVSVQTNQENIVQRIVIVK